MTFCRRFGKSCYHHQCSCNSKFFLNFSKSKIINFSMQVWLIFRIFVAFFAFLTQNIPQTASTLRYGSVAKPCRMRIQTLDKTGSRPRQAVFETETKSETFETESYKISGSQEMSRDRDQISTLYHW